MSKLYYDGKAKILSLVASDASVRSWPAANNAQKSSKGKWPNGTFPFVWHSPSKGGADSLTGLYGNMIFDVPGREGMGVHSGRAGKTDLAGRQGVEFSTNGCIRTSDEAMEVITSVHKRDKVVSITVVEN